MRMLSCIPTPHRTVPSLALGLDVGHRLASVPGADGVLGVVEHVDVDAEFGLERRHERGDRPVAPPGTVRCSPSTSSCAVTLAPSSPVVVSCDSSCTGGVVRAVLGVERAPHRRRADLGAACPR